MGKPHVPYQVKRLIDACLESFYDFEVLQSPASLMLTMSDGKNRFDCKWNKKADTDTAGKPTTRYKIEYMTHYPEHGIPTNTGIDDIEMIIRNTYRLGNRKNVGPPGTVRRSRATRKTIALTEIPGQVALLVPGTSVSLPW